MKHSLFISDLHLSAERPHINRQFFDFIRDTAMRAEALYILGDLFEYWIGDDDLAEPLHLAVADALRSLAAGRVRVLLMQGNRDVLLGQAFARRCRAELLAEPALLDLYGTPTLLMHGDTLCTDDTDYQRFRGYARDPDNQARFLAQPLEARRAQMLGMRAESEHSKQEKSGEIMDVTPATVEDVLRAYGYPRLIHGHTHRPARHVHMVDGRACERWVLNDWYHRGGYLHCAPDGCTARLL